MERAMANSEKLCKLSKESPEDWNAYSEIHKVIKLLDDICCERSLEQLKYWR